MQTLDQARIAEDRARPRVMQLWWSLRPLTSVIRFMNTGAHPDDEITSMLAALRNREGFSLSIACSTRGEGGQNDIGTEAGGDLGALRTAEMEQACSVLEMRLYWLSEAPDDSILDFGFSKSGTETLSRWGIRRTLTRLVEIVRTERPDIICPTFLDVPGQHGHHRAMTRTALEVMSAAADPEYPCNALPWQTKKLYLPAWSGAGRSYDDDDPPPHATLVFSAKGGDPVSGWSWERIGQQSRAFHRSQGMGRWVPAGDERDWPLHLVESHVDGPDFTLSSGLPATVADLASLAGAEPIAGALLSAGTALEAAVAAFPDCAAVADAALRALGHIRNARKSCPSAVRKEIDYRLAEKETQLGHVIRIALGVEIGGKIDRTWLHPGSNCGIALDVHRGSADGVDVEIDLPEGFNFEAGIVRLGQTVEAIDPYRAHFNPAAPAAPALAVRISAGETDVSCRLSLDYPPVVLPGRTATLEPDAIIVNLAGERQEIEVAVSDRHPLEAEPTLETPGGWTANRTDRGFSIAPLNEIAQGLYTVSLLLDGKAAASVRRISYTHIAPTAGIRPAEFKIRALSAELPNARVGYIGGGNDRVEHWLGNLGVNITDVTDDELTDGDSLESYDTLVVGIFAMRFRPGLRDAAPRLNRWAEAGGTLVTLYHRPWDNWDPECVPPKRLEIGQPSLRWRVTDPTALVKHIEPNHPVLNTPNAIGPGDWSGWHKERGLYFAKSWDDAYRPLIEMSDPGEGPHRGALLAADIGRGRHIHTSLTLHYQMEKLVPGAFRIMANMIARKA